MKKAEIKNLVKAAKRIAKAVKNNEKIIIYGDSDLDGISSVIILKETLSNIGSKNHIVYFPDREEEGYGLNESALAVLKKESPALFVTLDCGIGNIKEVDAANKMGFEVIIIDHHEPLKKYPKALIIVDPKQKGDKYPFKGFANAGLTFKLAEKIFKDNIPEPIRKSFLQLAAMATIADMMPREDDNEDIIIEGMSYIEDSWRPGIQSLFGLKDFRNLNLAERVSKVNSLMNIRNIEGGLPASYRIMTESDRKKADKLAELLVQMGYEKRKRIKEIINEVEDRFLIKDNDIIFEGDENWELILLGVVAAVVSKNTKKPVFLYRKYEEDSQGSVRAPDGYNTVEAMKTCDKFLLTYGGHPRASGFKVKNKHLDKFRKCLINYFAN